MEGGPNKSQARATRNKRELDKRKHGKHNRLTKEEKIEKQQQQKEKAANENASGIAAQPEVPDYLYDEGEEGYEEGVDELVPRREGGGGSVAVEGEESIEQLERWLDSVI